MLAVVPDRGRSGSTLTSTNTSNRAAEATAATATAAVVAVVVELVAITPVITVVVDGDGVSVRAFCFRLCGFDKAQCVYVTNSMLAANIPVCIS